MELKEIVLGTAQLGLDYGINNFNGKPSRSESLSILDRAYEQGIRIFDTAFAYGDAEEIIGEFITTKKLSNKIQIISKLEPNSIPENSKDVFNIVENKLQTSLRRTNLEVLDGYLLHTSSYIFRDDIVQALDQCKIKGLVKNIGASVYEEKEALKAVNSSLIDYIQIPYSIFDQRLDRTDFFRLAKDNGKKIFARTVFLQGLIFMDEKKIPDYLSDVKKYFKKFDEIINYYNLSRLQTAMMFSTSNPNIHNVVLGVDNVEQLDEDINIMANLSYNSDCMNDLKNEFLDIEKSIIFPSLWKK